MRNLTFFLALTSIFACSDGKDEGSGEDSDTSATGPYGPENDWYHAPDASLIPDESEAAEWTEGALIPNLRFTDQNGDEVWLYQFYGQTVFIDWVAEWCGPCHTFAPYLESFYQEYGDRAVVLTVVLMNDDGNDGDADAVERWVDTHSSTNPVLWMDAEQLARSPGLNSFPTIYLVDPELRLAVEDVNTRYDDTWIEQVVDRMVMSIGGSLDAEAEVCDDGFDNDLDLIADCMDAACADDGACPDSEQPGSLIPCLVEPEDVDTVVDVWEIEVRGAVASIEADTVSAATGFENILRLKAPGQTWDESRGVGDDEWDCTYPVEDYGCARGWIRPGVWQLLVQPGTGGDEYDGDCVDPSVGEYVLRTQGDVTLSLLHDNVTFGSL